MALTDAALRNAKPTDKAYALRDGGSLYLWVTVTGSKLWRWSYRHEGKEKLMSFGAYPLVSLVDARALRDE
ncbi:Arm DNA-binding domain-containing protein, partial [Acinetobacter baumannii]